MLKVMFLALEANFNVDLVSSKYFETGVTQQMMAVRVLPAKQRRRVPGSSEAKSARDTHLLGRAAAAS